MTKPTLTCVRGIPGSTKSTFASHWANFTGSVHLEADMFFVGYDGVYRYDPSGISDAHSWCQDAAYQALHDGKSVIVSNTFTRISELRPYFEIAYVSNISMPSVMLMQNDFGSIHGVPDDVVEKMKDRFCFDITSLQKEYTFAKYNESEVV